MVTIAVILIYVVAIGNIVEGVVVILSRYDVMADAVLPVTLIGAGLTLFGLLEIGVAAGLARGSRLARLAVTVYLAVQFALHVATIAASDTWDWYSITLIAVQVFIAIAVWAPPGSRYFARSDAAGQLVV